MATFNANWIVSSENGWGDWVDFNPSTFSGTIGSPTRGFSFIVGGQVFGQFIGNWASTTCFAPVEPTPPDPVVSSEISLTAGGSLMACSLRTTPCVQPRRENSDWQWPTLVCESINAAVNAAEKGLRGLEGGFAGGMAGLNQKQLTRVMEDAAKRHGLKNGTARAFIDIAVTPWPQAKDRLGLSRIPEEVIEEYGFTREDALDPYVNADIGADRFSRLLSRYGGNVSAALRAY